MPKSKLSLSPEEQKALAAEAVKRMDDVRQAMASPEAREDYLDSNLQISSSTKKMSPQYSTSMMGRQGSTKREV